MARLVSLAARASAVLTTGEVAATAIDLERCKDSTLSVQADFTKGSLTNVTLKFYVSMDGTTYYQVFVPGSASLVALTEVLTADGARAYTIPCLRGWKWFRASAQGSGTVTSSLLALTYRHAPGNAVR